MKRLAQLSTLVFAAAILAACGFQLRGQYNFDFDRIDLRGMERSPMQQTMRLQLQTLGLEVNPAQPAPLKLTLLGESRDRSIVTFSATGRAREVRITYELTYQVTDKAGDFLIATSQLSQRRELTYTDDEILGKEAEENRLYDEMQKDIARQIVVRLGALRLGQAAPAKAVVQ